MAPKAICIRPLWPIQLLVNLLLQLYFISFPFLFSNEVIYSNFSFLLSGFCPRVSLSATARPLQHEGRGSNCRNNLFARGVKLHISNFPGPHNGGRPVYSCFTIWCFSWVKSCHTIKVYYGIVASITEKETLFLLYSFFS